MNKVIDKGFRSCRFVSTIVKHPVYRTPALKVLNDQENDFILHMWPIPV